MIIRGLCMYCEFAADAEFFYITSGDDVLFCSCRRVGCRLRYFRDCEAYVEQLRRAERAEGL